jgi:hypothetical protein
MKHHIESYQFLTGEDKAYSSASRAVLLGATLRSTKLLLEANKDTCCLWELHLEVACLVENDLWKTRHVAETYVDLEQHAPAEVVNPEILQWMSVEEVEMLRQRMIWREGHVEVMDFYSAEFYDIDKGEFVGERRFWEPSELDEVLNLAPAEAEELRRSWEKKQTYRKFGL